LSRVGSAETKSLVMGLLVMKLQEHRMTCGAINARLKHITVLEEAHNLLRRPSPQSTDSSNLQAKSVEMLANAIAEMRTYGEGFIIADQAPGLLDMSVIRNTNTKILLRLPDESDRLLAGRSANLNDNQIIELARLPTGVAAVYQNNWIEPVLCKIDEFVTSGISYTSKIPYAMMSQNEYDELKKEIARCFLPRIKDDSIISKLSDLKIRIFHTNFGSGFKVKLLKAFDNEKSLEETDKIPFVSELFECNEATIKYINNHDMQNDDYRKNISAEIKPSIGDFDKDEQIIILQCILENYQLTHIRNAAMKDRSLTGGNNV
jgi:hypothetical protein